MEEKVNNKKIYDETWRLWHDMKLYGPGSRWIRHLIFDLISKIKNKDSIGSILDVGCGEGTTTYFIANHFKKSKVKGIDFSITGIECAKEIYKLPNLEFIYDQNSENLNFKYDLICCFEVLEHIENWQYVLDKIASASNKYLLVSFPTGRMRPYEVNVGHVRNFKKGEVEAFLTKLGFEAVQTYYAGFPFYSPIYREMCNITNSAGNKFTQGKYGTKQKIISNLFYILFKFFSTKKKMGDQFCGLFIKK